MPSENKLCSRFGPIVAWLLVFGLACKGAPDRAEGPLVVFYAASLEGVVGEWSKMFQDREGVEVRGESSGSQIAARVFRIERPEVPLEKPLRGQRFIIRHGGQA